VPTHLGRARRLALFLPVVLAGLTGAACDNSRPPETIDDDAFVRQANALCKRELPALRAERRESNFFGTIDEEDRTKTADRIEEVADELDRVAAELGALPVRRLEDQAEVAGWLEEWANFTGIGRQYAAAVRTERASVYTSIGAEGNGVVRRIARFARGNRIDECVL
jgi:hypothetical protein